MVFVVECRHRPFCPRYYNTVIFYLLFCNFAFLINAKTMSPVFTYPILLWRFSWKTHLHSVKNILYKKSNRKEPRLTSILRYSPLSRLLFREWNAQMKKKMFARCRGISGTFPATRVEGGPPDDADKLRNDSSLAVINSLLAAGYRK